MTQPEQCSCDYKDQHGVKDTQGIYQRDIYSSAKDIQFLNKLTNLRNRRFEIRVAPFDFAFAMLPCTAVSSCKWRLNKPAEMLLS